MDDDEDESEDISGLPFKALKKATESNPDLSKQRKKFVRKMEIKSFIFRYMEWLLIALVIVEIAILLARR
jgi:hypothetical protein